MLRDGFNFHSREAISQQRGIFVVEGHFRNPFRSCEMALVCQMVVSQLRNPLRNGSLAAKIGVLKLWGFRNPFRSCERIGGATKWHSCAKGWFHTCENFHKGGHGAAKSFPSQWAISQRLLGDYEIISQPRIIFAGALFRQRNFTNYAFSLFLSSSWFLASFFHLFWHSSLFWSSKNLYYIKTN